MYSFLSWPILHMHILRDVALHVDTIVIVVTLKVVCCNPYLFTPAAHKNHDQGLFSVCCPEQAQGVLSQS